MSFFAKVLNRAAAPGYPGFVLAIPKGAAVPLRRAEEEEEVAQPARRIAEEEETAQPLRRAEEEDEVQTLRRQEEEEEEVQTLRRQEEEEEEVQTLRRQEEEEEEIQTLRRQEEEEEEVQALRRQEEEEEEIQALQRQEEEEEEVQALRRREEEEEVAQSLRRASRAEDEMPPEPLPMQALRRHVPAPLAPGDTTPSLPAETQAPFAAFDPPVTAPGVESATDTPKSASERPRVQIDQIDVVIHEDASPSSSRGGDGLSRDLARRIRSTYLRGL